MVPCPRPQSPAPSASSTPRRYRALVRPAGARYIEAIDQRALPHAVVTARIADADTAALAIRDDVGARRTADRRRRRLRTGARARPRCLATPRSRSAHAALDATRPTAVNLRWALDRVRAAVARLPERERADAAWREADAIAAEDVAINHAIGLHGLALLRDIARRKSGPVQVMTHCNAGALATCGWGTATAPRVPGARRRDSAARVGERDAAAAAGRQSDRMGARGARRAAHAVRRRRERAADAARRRRPRHRRRRSRRGQRRRLQQDRHLRQGARRAPTTACRSTSRCRRRRSTSRSPSGAAIPIEARDADEVLSVTGRDERRRRRRRVRVAPAGTRAVNYAFDVTPARLVTGLVTERGVARAPTATAIARHVPGARRDDACQATPSGRCATRSSRRRSR